MTIVWRARAPRHERLATRWRDPAVDLPGDRGALLVHGFTATPMSMASLVGPLTETGIGTQTVCLPGHGTHPDALDLVVWQEWRSAVQTAWRRLRERYDRCALIGISLGAVLCRLLLNHGTHPDALVLLAMPWRIDDAAGRWLLPKLHRTTAGHRWVRIKDGGPDISDADLRAQTVSYSWTSLYALAEVDAALREQRRTAQPLALPTLMLHGAHDHVASVDGARLAARRFGRETQLEIMPRSWHVLTQDVEAAVVAARVAQFVDQCMAPSR